MHVLLETRSRYLSVLVKEQLPLDLATEQGNWTIILDARGLYVSLSSHTDFLQYVMADRRIVVIVLRTSCRNEVLLR